MHSNASSPSPPFIYLFSCEENSGQFQQSLYSCERIMHIVNKNYYVLTEITLPLTVLIGIIYIHTHILTAVKKAAANAVNEFIVAKGSNIFGENVASLMETSKSSQATEVRMG